MNIRKNIDYSAMFAALEAALSAEMPQIEQGSTFGTVFLDCFEIRPSFIW